MVKVRTFPKNSGSFGICLKGLPLAIDTLSTLGQGSSKAKCI